jgi:hypothetical protein
VLEARPSGSRSLSACLCVCLSRGFTHPCPGLSRSSQAMGRPGAPSFGDKLWKAEPSPRVALGKQSGFPSALCPPPRAASSLPQGACSSPYGEWGPGRPRAQSCSIWASMDGGRGREVGPVPPPMPHGESQSREKTGTPAGGLQGLPRIFWRWVTWVLASMVSGHWTGR